MIYRMFDLNIGIEEKYRETLYYLRDYTTDDNAVCDIKIKISDDEINKEMLADNSRDKSYYEMICIFRHITEEIADFNGMFLHCAVVEKENRGYIFTGHSGAGKTTHALLWKKHLGGRIINGDKPVLRFFDDGIYAYGSPWNGSEGLSENERVKLFAGCFIKQSKNNSVSMLNNAEVFRKLLNQTVIPQNPKRKIKHFDMLDRLIKDISFYELSCDISKEAVFTAFEGMRGV